MWDEWQTMSRAIGISGYILTAANLAFWLRLTFVARRAKVYPHFATELLLFAVALLFFVFSFLAASLPMEWRGEAITAARMVALLLGVAFTVHSIVAIRTAAA